MNLTLTQLATLKAWLIDNAVGLQDQEAANLLNVVATPSFTVWKTRVHLYAIGRKINGAELSGLTTANHTRLQTIIVLISDAGGVNPTLADQRAFFDDIFSGAGGAITRAALLALWKRLATVGEKLFAVGAGTDLAPATLGQSIQNGETIYAEGQITPDNVSQARQP